MRNQTTTVALFASLTTGVAFLLLAGHLGGPVSLSSEEVRADGQHLAGLAARTRIETPGTQRVAQITYTLGDDCGSYQGLALLSDWRPNGVLAEPETQLGFTAEIGARRLQRNPARPPLPFLALHRDPMSTDLVPAGHPRRVFVTVTSPPEGSGAEAPVSLRLGNVAGRPDLAAASALSWGFGALVRPADCRLGPEDHRVLVILARLVRARICDEPAAERFCADSAVTLFRDRRPRTYRLDVRALGGGFERAAFGLRVKLDDEGRPRSAELRLLPERSALDRRAVVSFIRPRPPGAPLASGSGSGASLVYEPGAEPAIVTVDLEGLLAGTKW